MAAVRCPDLVLRRRRRRGAGGGPGGRAGAPAAGAGPDILPGDAALRRRPGHAGAPPRPAGFAAVLPPSAPWPRPCSTSCARAFRRHAGGPGCAASPGWTPPPPASGDKALASEYRSALRDRFFATARRRGGKPAAATAPPVRPGRGRRHAERHRALLAILLNHPVLIGDVAEALSGLPLDARYAGLRGALVNGMIPARRLDSGMPHEPPRTVWARRARAVVLAARPVPLPACAGAGAMPAEAEAGWWHFFGLLNRHRLEQEVTSAAAAFAGVA